LGTLLLLKIVGNGKVEDRAQEGLLVASHEEAVEEGADLGVNGMGLGVQPVEPVDHSKNEASQDARRVGAVPRQGHVQVERFLVESVGHSAIFDRQLKVEEDCGIRALGDFPAKLSELVEVFLKALPHSVVEVFIGAVPDSEGVINVALVDQKESAVLAKDGFLFVDTKVQGSLHWGLRSTHGGAGELQPAGISQLEEVVFHDHVEGCHDCLVVWCQREVSTDDRQGMIGVDVSVHRDSVGCEEPGAVWEIRQIFQEVS
jgi:hypothetical protein